MCVQKIHNTFTLTSYNNPNVHQEKSGWIMEFINEDETATQMSLKNRDVEQKPGTEGGTP